MPSSELVKELYARFGLAYYHSECLHKELCHYYVLITFQKPEHLTRPRFEEKLSAAYSLTLGRVVELLKELLPGKLCEELEYVVDVRNFLAHHFWFERAHLMFSESGIEKMIDELDAYSLQFSRLDEEVGVLTLEKVKELGIPECAIQCELEKCVSGEPPESLPKKRKLKKQERLEGVWEGEMDGGKVLFFQLGDGTLWQLCDVGLGWCIFDATQASWAPQEEINKYLPAVINPRPKIKEAWAYEFQLAHGSIFWVKPGGKPRTFKCGLKEVTRSCAPEMSDLSNEEAR